MIHLGDVPASSTLYIPFATYGKTNGESITLTGLAVTDIEIYKNGSVTQRASDNGYTLLDTDGIDFDGITGIHGFSVDLSDNSDSGFYAAGSFYWVVVSAVTIDSQTVNFIAATFRIRAAEATAGYPVVTGKSGTGTGEWNLSSGVIDANVTKWSGTAVAAVDTAGYPKVTVKSGTGTGEISLTSGVAKADLETIKTQTVTCAAGVTVLASVGTASTSTAQTGDGYAIVNSGTHGNAALKTLLDNIDNGIDGVDTAVDAILIDTGELQTDWTNGGRLDLLIDAIKSKTDLIPAAPASTTNITAGTITTVTNLTNLPATAALEATLGGLVTTVGVAGLGLSAIPKTGYKLASDGLDSVSTTAPAGVASNFREMLVQLWRRAFKRSTLTSTELKTYADNGTSVLTTQTVSDNGTVQDQGAAS